MPMKPGLNLYSLQNTLARVALSFILSGAIAVPGQVATTAPTLSMDSALTQPAPEPLEAIKLSTQGAFTSLSPRVGDSLDYVLQVEWQDTQVPVFVLAPDSLRFEGFQVLGQAAVHKKLAQGHEIRNHTEFIYRLRAQTQGNGRATAIKLRYLSGISKSEEAVFVPTALVDILAAPVKITEMLWFKLLGSLVLLAGAIALAWGAFKITLRRHKPSQPEKMDLRPEVAVLKNRIKSVYNSPDAAKEISLIMETLAQRFLRQEIETQKNPKGKQKKGPIDGTAKSSPAESLPEKFEPLLDIYLALNGKLPLTETDSALIAEWAKLRELFRHARFAGGYKEAHELQDAFRTFKKCLKITGEDDYE